MATALTLAVTKRQQERIDIVVTDMLGVPADLL
jgi:hypothetical protein